MTKYKVPYRFITVEGNIGAGKTTLTTLLQRELNAKLILEQFADNPFLPKFYKNKDKYAFPLELSFLAERYKQLRDNIIHRDLFSEYIISDYLFVKSKLFAKVNLPEDEFSLYETLFDIVYTHLPKPDLIIYLDTPLQKLRNNIVSRNRSYEQEIPDSYLIDLHDAYINMLKSNDYTTLFVDTTSSDFLHNECHFHQLMQAIEKNYTPGRHYLQIQ